jgi:membrane-associated phospholipid phosphatase
MGAFPQSKLNQKNLEEFSRLLKQQNTQKAVSLFSFTSPIPPETTLERLLAWNKLALETTAIDHTPVAEGSGDDPRRFAEQLGPHRASYAMAIVHIAMFEAVNSIFQEYKSYTGLPQSNKALKASSVAIDRAIARSAHDALVSLFPYQKPRIDSLYTTDIARMPKEPSAEILEGDKIGKMAAASILQMRQNDGSELPEPQYGKEFNPKTCDSTPNCPGVWSPDPTPEVKLTVALGGNWSKVKPFVLQSADQFRPAPPPSMKSQEYSTAFKEVKAYGAANSTVRMDNQEFEGLFWAYDGTPALCAPPRLYNQIAVTVAIQKRLGDVSKVARYLALINTAMADAAISAWDAKYFYQLWRPVTGIRQADLDENQDTDADKAWIPMGAPATNAKGPNFTPPFPAYPSGHAVFGGALFEVMRTYWADKTPFTFVSDEYNGLNYPVGDSTPRPNIPMSFVSFSHAERSNGKSRIWLGIHWQFDADAGISQGNALAKYVAANAFQPVSP